jgi:hypothetical protein
MVGASPGHPRIVNRLLDLQIGAISQVADVNDGHQDLRVLTEIHPLAVFVDGLPRHDERSPGALGLDTEELVDNGHHLTPLSRKLREVHATGRGSRTAPGADEPLGAETWRHAAAAIRYEPIE